MTDPPTRVAVLTPAGAGAIATLAVVGPRAWEVCRPLFRPGGAAPAEPPTDRPLHGHFGEPPGDEVVLAVRRLRPEPWVEVHCHGGPQVVRWLVRQLEAHGVTAADWRGGPPQGKHGSTPDSFLNRGLGSSQAAESRN